MKAKRFLKKVGRLELSYLPEAPDHGLSELAVVLPDRRRYVVVAVGEQAESLFACPDEDRLRALAEKGA